MDPEFIHGSSDAINDAFCITLDAIQEVHRAGGTILKVVGPALILEKSGGARPYVLPYFYQKVVGPRPHRPIPFRRA